MAASAIVTAGSRCADAADGYTAIVTATPHPSPVPRSTGVSAPSRVAPSSTFATTPSPIRMRISTSHRLGEYAFIAAEPIIFGNSYAATFRLRARLRRTTVALAKVVRSAPSRRSSGTRDVDAGGLQMSTAMQPQPSSSIVSWTQIIYALHAFSLLTGSLVPQPARGMPVGPRSSCCYLNHIKRGEAREKRGLRWQIRTFWFGGCLDLDVRHVMTLGIGILIAGFRSSRRLLVHLLDRARLDCVERMAGRLAERSMQVALEAPGRFIATECAPPVSGRPTRSCACIALAYVALTMPRREAAVLQLPTNPWSRAWRRGD